MIFKKTAKNLTKKNGLRKAWKNKHRAFDGKKLWAQAYARHVGTDVAIVAINAGMTPKDHRAIEEIAEALTLWNGKPSCTMRYSDAPRCSAAVTDRQERLWSRFSLWYDLTAYYARKERDAAILFAQGFGIREIETKLKIRHGKTRNLIRAGCAEYIDISGW